MAGVSMIHTMEKAARTAEPKKEPHYFVGSAVLGAFAPHHLASRRFTVDEFQTCTARIHECRMHFGRSFSRQWSSFKVIHLGCFHLK